MIDPMPDVVMIDTDYPPDPSIAWTVCDCGRIHQVNCFCICPLGEIEEDIWVAKTRPWRAS